MIDHPRIAGRNLAARFLRHSNYRRFIVLSRSRVGSNLLISYLNHHPNISSEWEVLNELHGRSYKDVLATTFARQPIYVKARGFKLFYYHARDDETSGVWDDLVNMQDLHVIHLKRHNIFRTLVSRKIAGIQNTWTSEDVVTTHRNSSIQVSFTSDELVKSFEETRRWEMEGDNLFREHPMITIWYEDLVTDLDVTFRRITDFLGVRYVHPETLCVYNR